MGGTSSKSTDNQASGNEANRPKSKFVSHTYRDFIDNFYGQDTVTPDLQTA